MRENLLLKFVLVVSLISLPLHFVWEWLQCVPYFVHRVSKASPSMMFAAASGDVLLTLLILGLLYIVTDRDKKFLSVFPTLRKLMILEFIAFFITVVVEKWALETGRWSYTDINPLMPGINVSLLPVLQLMLLTPFILFLTVAIFKKNQRESSKHA